MANPKRRLNSNREGEYFVDQSCINCDTCRQVSPDVFGEIEGRACVANQPSNEIEQKSALRALVCCPVGAIGTLHPNKSKESVSEFPIQLTEDVFYVGFNSSKSYGANSYLLKHASGNWLIDSPRYSKTLAKQLEKIGGVRFIFLTHADDVADAREWAKHFDAQRLIHEREIFSQPDAEIVLRGESEMRLDATLRVIVTPGHTQGHCVLLVDNKYLFTGDHLYWNRDEKSLRAFDDACWYSWGRQTESMEKLASYPFGSIFPGHGQRVTVGVEQMKEEIQKVVAWMRKKPLGPLVENQSDH